MSTMIKPIIVQNAVDHDVFIRSIHDEKIGFSEEDRQFIRLMDKGSEGTAPGAGKPLFPSQNTDRNYQTTNHRR